MTQHTKEPWTSGTILISDANGDPVEHHCVGILGSNIAIALTGVVGSVEDELSKADAKRIEVCVNRCEGIDTETLENSPDLATAFMSAENARLMQVNAVLFAALVEYRNDVRHMLKGRFLDLKAVEHELTAAIAKAEAA